MRARLALPLLLLLAAACSRHNVLVGRDRLVPGPGDTLVVHGAAMPAGDVARVTLRVRSGAVVVAAGRDDSVRATLAVGQEGSWQGRSCDPDRAARARVDIARDGDGLRISSSPPLGDRCHEFWHVEVPARVALDAHADVARMKVDGVAGGVRLSVAVGSIAASVPRGDVDAEVRDVGDVEVRTATDDYGDASVQANVGDASIDIDAHRVDAAKPPGAGERVALRGSGRDRIQLRTGVGDARLHIDRRPARPGDASGGHDAHAAHAPRTDSAFAALQRRGAKVMGVDQSASAHRFDPLPDGGRIELQMLADDTAGTRTIREHLRAQAAAFARGDFANPVLVHGVAATADVPGAAVLARRRDAVSYAVRDLPRGAELRITTRDAEALAAVHAFLAWQRGDHRVER